MPVKVSRKGLVVTGFVPPKLPAPSLSGVRDNPSAHYLHEATTHGDKELIVLLESRRVRGVGSCNNFALRNPRHPIGQDI